MRELTCQDLENLIPGILLYGGGGGGSGKIGESWVHQIQAQSCPAKMVSIDEVEDDAGVVMIFIMANPSTSTSLPGDLAIRSFEAVRAYLAPKLDLRYVLAVEIGCAIGPTPLFLSAALASQGILAVDGDATGRTAPVAGATTFGDLPASPTVLTSATQFHYYCEGDLSAGDFESMLQGVIGPPFNSLAGIAVWPVTGSEMKRRALPGTIGKAIQLGELVRAKRPPEEIAASMNGDVLFQGRLQCCVPFASPTPGAITIVTGGETLTIYNNFENLIAWHNNKSQPAIMVPDIIALFNLETGLPFSTAPMDVPPTGTQVAVIGAPAPQALMNPGSLAAFAGVVRSSVHYGGPFVSPFRKEHTPTT